MKSFRKRVNLLVLCILVTTATPALAENHKTTFTPIALSLRANRGANFTSHKNFNTLKPDHFKRPSSTKLTDTSYLLALGIICLIGLRRKG